MDTITTTCYAIKKDGTQCTHAGTPTTCYTYGNVARSTMPLHYDGDAWMVSRIYVCGTHLRSLMKGALSINYPMSKEDTTTMPSNQDNVYCSLCDSTGHGKEGPHDEYPCDCFKPFVKDGVMYIQSECVTCGFVLAQHPDHDKYREPTTEEILADEAEVQKKQVLCGKCRKNGVPHPYHDNINQVRICYLKKF